MLTVAEGHAHADESRLRRIGKNAVSLIAITTSLFHLYTGAFGIFGALVQRSAHVYLLAALTFAVVPFMRRRELKFRIVDLFLILLSLSGMIYVILNYQRMLNKTAYVTPPAQLDYLFTVISVLLVIEATRRVVGRLLAAVVTVILVGSFFSNLLPAPLTSPQSSPSTWVDGLFITTNGLWGIPTRVSATFIFLFVVLAAFLEVTGAGRFLIDLAKALVGSRQGGAAKVSVIASSLFGSLSGSAAANVYGTGIFTIPTMKKFGYSNSFSGSTEVAASCGGQIMPPIMGAGAFIMAQFLGVDYIVIAMAAIIPAALYYVSVYFAVHAETLTQGIRPMPDEEIPSVRGVIRDQYDYALAFFVTIILLFYMLIRGYTIYRAVFLSLVGLMLVAALNPRSRVGVPELTTALDKGARNATQIAMATASASIVLGALNTSGIGVIFGQVVVGLAGGDILLLLVLVAVFSIILGFGMPTTAAYILAAALLGPALVAVNMGGLPAQFYIFTFAVYSTITPPVALAAFAAGQVADADPMRVALTAMKMVLPTFIIPIRYIFRPAILLQMPMIDIVIDTVALMVAVIAIQAGMWGWPVQDKISRTFAVLASLLLLVPPQLVPISDLWTLIGAGVICLLVSVAFEVHSKGLDSVRSSV
jgi:TRAP transporter 4TM/12TM fusion protein